MADKLGSPDSPAFYTAGAVLVIGASIMSLMAFVTKPPAKTDEMQSNDNEQLFVTERITVL